MHTQNVLTTVGVNTASVYKVASDTNRGVELHSSTVRCLGCCRWKYEQLPWQWRNGRYYI